MFHLEGEGIQISFNVNDSKVRFINGPSWKSLLWELNIFPLLGKTLQISGYFSFAKHPTNSDLVIVLTLLYNI